MTEDMGKLIDEQGEPAESQTVSSNEEGKGTRMDAAKAFFRALHAGAEEQPPDLELTGASESERADTGASHCKSCQYLEGQLAEATQRLQESENLYKRMMADFDNFRRRIAREREEFLSTGIQKAIESLLPALDDMDRAQASLNPNMSSEKLLESLKLVFNRINRCLEQIGVQPLIVIGQHFDPKFHEPVQEVATTEFPDGSVIHELRRGYTLNDKVIRPALVNVAANAGACQTQPATPSEAQATGVGSAPDREPKVYDLSEYENVDLADESLGITGNECWEIPTGGGRATDE